jgi:hypothetical protein
VDQIGGQVLLTLGKAAEHGVVVELDARADDTRQLGQLTLHRLPGRGQSQVVHRLRCGDQLGGGPRRVLPPDLGDDVVERQIVAEGGEQVVHDARLSQVGRTRDENDRARPCDWDL